jgi:hypothetical protein
VFFWYINSGLGNIFQEKSGNPGYNKKRKDGADNERSDQKINEQVK